MLNINRVAVTGRLTRDPETKYLPSGQAVTSFTVASDRNYQDKNGEWKKETMFIDVETWAKTAERVAESLRKGSPVYVEGRLKQDNWEKDGQKHSKIRISADRATAFEVPSKAGSGAGLAGEPSDESYGESSAPRSSGSRKPQSTGAASDNLDFQNSSVKDDIPF